MFIRCSNILCCFSRPTPTFPRFAICSRRYCVDLVGFGTITGNTKLLRLKEGWEESATIYAAVLADPGDRRTAEESYERGEVTGDGVP